MRTILPFASNSLHLPMSPTQTTEAREHAPTALNPQELSRSVSPPQQSNLSLLVRRPDMLTPSRLTVFQVSNGTAALRSPPPAADNTSLSTTSPPLSHSEPSVSIQSILSSASPSVPTTNGQQPSWNGHDASSRDNNYSVAGPSTMPPPASTQVSLHNVRSRWCSSGRVSARRLSGNSTLPI